MKTIKLTIALLAIFATSCTNQSENIEILEPEINEDTATYHDKVFVSYVLNEQNIKMNLNTAGSRGTGYGAPPINASDSINLNYRKEWTNNGDKISFSFNFLIHKNKIPDLDFFNIEFSKKVFLNTLNELNIGNTKFRNDFLKNGIDSGIVIQGDNPLKEESFSSNIDYYWYKTPPFSDLTYQKDYIIIDSIEYIKPTVYLVYGEFHSTIYYKESNTFDELSNGKFCIPLTYEGFLEIEPPN